MPTARPTWSGARAPEGTIDRPTRATARTDRPRTAWLMPRRRAIHPVETAVEEAMAASWAPICSMRRPWAPKARTSRTPWTESVTWAASSPRATRRSRAATRDALAPRTGTTRPETSRKQSSTRASHHDVAAPIHPRVMAGTTTAVHTGARVWAKNTSMRSMSFVTRLSRSPESRESDPAGAWGSSWS